jgi:hypothetical protein
MISLDVCKKEATPSLRRFYPERIKECGMPRYSFPKNSKYVHNSCYASGVYVFSAFNGISLMAFFHRSHNLVVTEFAVLHTHRFRFIAEVFWLLGNQLSDILTDNLDVSRVAPMLGVKFMSRDDDLRWLAATDPKLLVRGLLGSLITFLISPESALCKGLVTYFLPVAVFDPDVADLGLS